METRTEENYRRCLRLHILPRWDQLKLLRQRYAASTVVTFHTALSTIIDDAADERLIAANPVRRRRRRPVPGPAHPARFELARTVALTARECLLLELFLRHPGQVLSREQVLSHVWGYDFLPRFQRRGRLRRCLAPQLGDERITTVRVMGYVLSTDRTATNWGLR